MKPTTIIEYLHRDFRRPPPIGSHPRRHPLSVSPPSVEDSLPLSLTVSSSQHQPPPTNRPLQRQRSSTLDLKSMASGEEEYVLLDLDSVSGQIHIPPNAPYVLSGLDTLNPILIIDEKIKLIGEYEETIGTCLVFSENNAPPVVHEETGPSEANLFSGKCIINPNEGTKKQVKPVCQLQKVLRFKLLQDDQTIEDSSMKND
ncbi:hypothetical protein L2E82_37592 [Cichorium intybus]|uniref:Uncharacterized protein n=1 Tax=Cichorium intybus TaxID=13427 RepID=A0ACB9AGC1_CICIN|nr:hypothetical protein L2E82_37592 [Cichorium intybus]